MALGIFAPAATAAAAPSIAVSGASAAPGETVTLNVQLSGNPGLVAARFAIDYDPYLTLVSATDGGILKGAQFGADTASDPYYVTWYDTAATADNTKNGTILTLTFKVSADAPKGAQQVRLAAVPGDFVNNSLKCVNVALNGAIVSVNGDSHIHSFTEYVPDGNATCTEDGTKTAVCDKGCGATDTIPDPGSATGHSFTAYVPDGNATCTEDGTKTAVCGNGCGATDTLPDAGSATGHSFTAYVPDGNATCTEDGTKTAVCGNGCGATDTLPDPGSAKGHVFSEYVYNGDATYDADGTETARCDNGCGLTDTRVAENSRLIDSAKPSVTILTGIRRWSSVTEAEAHPIYRNEPFPVEITASDSESGVESVSYFVSDRVLTEEEIAGITDWTDGYSVDFSDAGSYALIARAIDRQGNAAYASTPLLVLNFSLPTVTGVESGAIYCDGSVTVTVEDDDLAAVTVNGEPAELADGKLTLTVPDGEVAVFTVTASDEGGNSVSVAFTLCGGHRFEKYTPDGNAACTADGTKTAVCENGCGATDTLPDPGSATGHRFEKYAPDGNATCTEDGTKTAVCENGCGATDTLPDPGSATGHRFEKYEPDGNATCTEDGTKTAVCENGCGATDTLPDPGSATGHRFEKYEPDGNATCTEDGTKTAVCENGCGATDTVTDAGSAKGHSWGDWTVVKEATVTDEGEAVRVCRNDPSHTETRKTDRLPLPFRDVPGDAYYAGPVAWAVSNGITSGTSPATFSPEEGCTRGQVVTFLWRAAGSPEPKGGNNPFRDVKGADYFYKAVLWAVENGVTAGTSPKTFSPDDTCTRGQIVTFLWRANGQAAPKGSTNPFRDVKSGDYFYSAVLWAVENGVTAGTSPKTFSPNDTCTRAQVVTFLKRAHDAAEKDRAPAPDCAELFTDSVRWDDGPSTSIPHYSDARQTIIDGIRSFTERIDVSAYGLTPDNLRMVFQSVSNAVPDLFYVNNEYKYSKTSDGKIVAFIPTYVYSRDEAEALKEEYENDVNSIVALVESSWSDLEKALYVHDAIAVMFEYDNTYTVRNVLDFFREGKGVCQAYTLLYLAVLERLGVPVDSVTSSTMNHTWNRVKVDGKWYHVDVTWDDPTTDRFGLVNHKYFLVSDASIGSDEGRHNDWEGYVQDLACTDTKYDSAFWRDVISPFVPLGGNWYFIGKSGSGYAMKRGDLVTSSDVFAVNDKWYAEGGITFWIGYYSGLVKYDGCVVYNTTREILAYDPITRKTSCLFRVADDSRDIYGIAPKDGISYATAAAPSETPDRIAAILLPVAPYDADADGYVSMRDAVYLFRYVGGTALYVNLAASDVDGNGSINKNDYTAMRRHLAG